MSGAPQGETAASFEGYHPPGALASVLRIFALTMTGVCFAFVLSSFLTFWGGAPGIKAALAGEGGGLGWLQIGLYLFAVALPVGYVLKTNNRMVHDDGDMLSGVAAFIVRAAFWAVLIMGVADMVISFLRVEGLLVGVVGEQLASDLGPFGISWRICSLSIVGHFHRHCFFFAYARFSMVNLVDCGGRSANRHCAVCVLLRTSLHG